uniref:Uncharacterized protein n=1 Tax=Proboscia inermis TaxID=420281 RepID=A0A7S0C6A0_9STRA
MDLISAANENHKIHKAQIGTVSIPHPSDDDGDGSASANGSPAYKPKPKHRFAALKLNVREERDLKRMNQKHTWKKIRAKRNKNKSVNNYHSTTMIEFDGTVRPATVEELKCVSWKPPRSDNIKEFMMRDVKKAWVQRQKGVEDAWGRMDAFVPPKVEGDVEGVKEGEKNGVDEVKD